MEGNDQQQQHPPSRGGGRPPLQDCHSSPSSPVRNSTSSKPQSSNASNRRHHHSPPSDPQAEQALKEAEAVLEAIGGDSHLDGFNLLSVIANPRGGSLTAAAAASSSSTTGYGHSSSAAAAAAAAAAVAADHNDGGAGMLADTYHTLEATLTQVTEQMDALNMVLEDWSRQLLEDPYLSSSHDDHVPESVLKELPDELQNLDLDSLQSYLERSGVMAHAFHQRQQRHHQQQHDHEPSSSLPDRRRTSTSIQDEPSRVLSDDALQQSDAVIRMEDLEKEIPEIFFRPDFDLTDPDTFQELLLLRVGDGVAATTALGDGRTSSKQSPVVNTDGPVQEWFPLAPQDTFGGFLDRVELALLQQVRAKSDDFFQESLRFGMLQEWIQALVGQVVQLQGVVDQLHRDLLTPMEVVPSADEQRRAYLRLQTVLDKTAQLFACKHSIAGLLSAQDDMGAIDQIQYGRKLLAGTADPEDNDERAPGSDPKGEKDEAMELHRLLAAQTVADQLDQYEHLVVTNLREELVEILLEWNSAAVSSLYVTSSSRLPGGSGGGGTSLVANQRHEVRERVKELVTALGRCRGLSKSREAYGNRLHEVIRITVRTIVSEFASEASASENGGSTATSVSSGATAMSLERFVDCLDIMFEQLMSILTAASGVDKFCLEEHISFQDDAPDSHPNHSTSEGTVVKLPSPAPMSPLAEIIHSAAELSSKSVSELLRLRKEAHSLVTLDEMKRIWDKCMAFTAQLEDLSGHKASALRSTLLAQAKAFIERKHESNMSALAAALDSERWTQCDVSAERQNALSRLCQGRAAIGPSLSHDGGDAPTDTRKAPEVELEGTRYKVVWSCLLLMEMVISDLMAATYFSSLASGLVAKVAEILRLFNTRTTQLVLGAGAIHSAARLKSINAKHLSLVAQCLRLISSTLPHVRASLMTQLPPKQHTLLSVMDQIKKDYAEHNEKILNKFVTIIGGIVEHGLAPKLRGTDFDARSRSPPSPDGTVTCCVFFEGISTNTRKMHQVLSSLLPPDHLQDVFSRIFAFVDQKVPTLVVSIADETPSPANPSASFQFPKTDEGKHRLLLEVDVMSRSLNGLDGVRPWEFTIATVLSKHLEMSPPVSINGARLDVDVPSATECNGSTSHGTDPHPSEVVSEAGTDVTSETLTTADTTPADDPTQAHGVPAGDGDDEVPPAIEGGETPAAESLEGGLIPTQDVVESSIPDPIDADPPVQGVVDDEQLLPASEVTTL